MAKPIKRKILAEVVDPVSPLGLPRASERLKANHQSGDTFENIPKREYNNGIGLKGDDSTPLKEFLPDYKPDEFFRYVAQNANAGVQKDIAEAMRQLNPDLFEAFQNANLATAAPGQLPDGVPQVAPELWEHRTTGRKVSPADFIREHYAPWLGGELTRAHIGKLDEKLYTAYAQQIRRNPDQAVQRLISQEHKASGSAEEILDERRARDRARKARPK